MDVHQNGINVDDMPHQLLTPQEAAERLAITVEQLHDLVHDGEIAYIAVGRGSKRPRRRFTEQDLSDFIEQRRRREPSSSIVGFSALRAARFEKKRVSK
ncbi:MULTISPECIES: helix-turn-helix domain-containing protein [unclassified Bradyrhizobium]